MQILRMLSGLCALITTLAFAHHVLFQDYLGADQQMIHSPIYWAFMVFAVSVVILGLIGSYLLIRRGR
ncbi:MAG TPA: hypothetical protein VHT28_07040 [Silvibacterium sp.]|jgi:uncharacterized membrane protein|nr:hypothetical protein [Silvibacterium sp.]